jgi:glutaredoxin
MKIKSILLSATLFAAALLAGWWAGQGFGAIRARWNTETLPIAGDYSAHFTGSQKPLVLYATQTCPWCRKTRDWLDAQHLEYELRLIDQDANFRERYQSLHRNGVPILLTRQHMVIGFDLDAVRKISTGQ